MVVALFIMTVIGMGVILFNLVLGASSPVLAWVWDTFMDAVSPRR